MCCFISHNHSLKMSVKVKGASKDVLNDNDSLGEPAAGVNGGKMINKWTTEEVAHWLNSCGFQDCVEVFQFHSISGSVVPRLNPDLLREMGLQSVGRRIELQSYIVTIQAKARAQWRNEVLWAEPMYRPGYCNGAMPYGFPFCCECCTGVPDIYKVTNSKLNILANKKNVPFMGCFGWKVVSINKDLTNIKDVDVTAKTSCIGDPDGVVIVNMDDGELVELVLQSSQCQKVNAIITNAKEEANIQEGLQKFGRG